ncbi:hypothetical protein [Streptomyces sp. NPDC057623]|uniref:hypothetical protein n=1 Tax=Streptomyces sp. NPDC057623 TaxID=3346187 RepID=UPI003680ED30
MNREYITRYLGSDEHWHPEVNEEFGVPCRVGSGKDHGVMGARAWQRSVLTAGDLGSLKEFPDWDTGHGRLAAGDITATSTDAELDRRADRAQENAER